MQPLPQHVPGQLPACFVCEAVSATADNENSDTAIRPRSLAFIEISFPCEKSSRAHARLRACAEKSDSRKALNPKIVFETKDRRPVAKPWRQFPNRLRRGALRRIHANRRCHSNRRVLFRPLALRLGLLRRLLCASRRGTAFSVPRLRAARHMTARALHRRCNGRIAQCERGHPHSGQGYSQ